MSVFETKVETTGDKAIKYLVASMGIFPQEAKSWLRDWVNDRKTFSRDVFKAVVDEIATVYEAREGSKKPSVRLVVKKYEARLSNHSESAARQGEICGKCRNSGRRWVVLGGENSGHARLVDPRRVQPLCYVVSNMVPCICACGQRCKGYADWSHNYLMRVGDFTFADGLTASRFASACRLQWEQQNNYPRAYALAPNSKGRSPMGEGEGLRIPQDSREVKNMANEVSV